MDWSEGLFYVLIVFCISGAIGLLMRSKIKLSSIYKILVVVLHPGCNIHQVVKPNTLPHSIKITAGGVEQTYTIKLEELWKVKQFFIRRPLNFLMGIKGPYLCLFRSNETGEPIKNVEAKATPILIRNVKQSRILRMALREIFKEGVGGFSKFVLIFGGACAVLYILWQQGYIG